MSSESSTSKLSKIAFWSGWLLTMLISTALTMSGVMKLLKPQPLVEGFEKFGYPVHLATGIGVVELICTALYIVPQTSVLGAILLTGYLGGATATHVRIGEMDPAPVIMGVLMWFGLYLRDVRLQALVPFRKLVQQ